MEKTEGGKSFEPERQKQRDGERKLERKKEGKRRTTVGLPLHHCYNAATEKGVSINREKKTAPP
jgi:hypothetical protein